MGIMNDAEQIREQVDAAIEQLQGGEVVTVHSATMVNALMTRLMVDTVKLDFAVRARWGKGYVFTPMAMTDGVAAGVY
jgi:hypothetical protein